MIPMNIFMALICVKNYVLHRMRSEKNVIDVNSCKNGANGNSLPSRLVENKYYLDILTYVTN